MQPPSPTLKTICQPREKLGAITCSAVCAVKTKKIDFVFAGAQLSSELSCFFGFCWFPSTFALPPPCEISPPFVCCKMAFNTLGVSLPFLKLMRNHPRFREEMTTTDFCNEIAMPDTKERKCAYIELFAGKRDEKGRLYIAPATAFVSHAWKYKFVLPYDVMEHHDDPDAYFWFDVFINNQHTATTNTFEWWKTTFQQAIVKIGTVLLVMSPWNAPIPLSRVS